MSTKRYQSLAERRDNLRDRWTAEPDLRPSARSLRPPARALRSLPTEAMVRDLPHRLPEHDGPCVMGMFMENVFGGAYFRPSAHDAAQLMSPHWLCLEFHELVSDVQSIISEWDEGYPEEASNQLARLVRRGRFGSCGRGNTLGPYLAEALGVSPRTTGWSVPAEAAADRASVMPTEGKEARL